MTVEATSFLSTSKISNSHEKSAKILKNHKNLIIILLAFVLLLFCILASILQIYIFKELNKAQEEINQLKKDVTEIKRNEFDRQLITDINAFSRKYNNQNDVKDQIDLDLDEKIDPIDDKIKFDDVGEDNEGEEEEEEEELDGTDDNYEGFHSGYGDEEYDDDYDLEDSLEDDLPEPEKDDNNNIYEDIKKLSRKTRSITGITEQGVPIIEEPYALRRNRTKLAELNREKNPRLKLTWNGNHRNMHGQQRKDFNQERHRHHHNNNNMRHHQQHKAAAENSNRFAFAAAPVHHISHGFGQKFNESTPIPIQTRQSRVMHFEDKTKAFRQVVNKDQLAKLQEQRLPPIEHASMVGNGGRRRLYQNMPLRKNLELRNAKRMKITAVHYDGDSTILGESHHVNGKVTLNKNEYMHWKQADWVHDHGMNKFFNMDSTGTLTINDHGLFLIYAQVYYIDNHDLNGYEIVHNNHVKYQCTTMTHTGSDTSKAKTNSCYTSGLIHLRNGDKIRLRDVGNHRHVLMQPNKSFFGLIKINLLPSIASGIDSSSSTDIDQFERIK